MGFTPLLSDKCVYVRDTGTPDVAFIATWVDDLLIMGQNTAMTADIKKDLGQRSKMKDLGSVSQYLGMRIQRDRENRITTIDQLAYMVECYKKLVSPNTPIHHRYLWELRGSLRIWNKHPEKM